MVFVQKLLMKFEYQSRMGITLDTYEETNITKKKSTVTKPEKELANIISKN